jgi:hypothetical protein
VRTVFDDGDSGELRALHHHWVRYAENQGFGRETIRLDVAGCPTGGDAILTVGKTNFITDVRASELVSRLRDQPGLAIDVLARVMVKVSPGYPLSVSRAMMSFCTSVASS